MDKILFLDRDGVLIEEPEDQQIDSVEKFKLLPNLIPSLLMLQEMGFVLVMVSNQDGLGTSSYPQEKFDRIQTLLLGILNSQGIFFKETLICPHTPKDGCECRKPKSGLVEKYLASTDWDRKKSYFVGDRDTDIVLASKMGVQGIKIGSALSMGWNEVLRIIQASERKSIVIRKTKETSIEVSVDLDQRKPVSAKTGIGFFDHMLESLAKHGGFSLDLKCAGDLEIDEHHTVEDCALALGEAIRKALGNRIGISRFGFTLPMDETLAEAALDLSGRPYFVFEGKFPRESVGELHTEMVLHFFRSFSESMAANLHLKVKGENTHHLVEACFKVVGRALRQAIRVESLSEGVPSTKGVL